MKNVMMILIKKTLTMKIPTKKKIKCINLFLEKTSHLISTHPEMSEI